MKSLLIKLVLLLALAGCGGSEKEKPATFDSVGYMKSLLLKIKVVDNKLVI